VQKTALYMENTVKAVKMIKIFFILFEISLNCKFKYKKLSLAIGHISSDELV